jgi:hypothetical protein
VALSIQDAAPALRETNRRCFYLIMRERPRNTNVEDHVVSSGWTSAGRTSCTNFVHATRLLNAPISLRTSTLLCVVVILLGCKMTAQDS